MKNFGSSLFLCVCCMAWQSQAAAAPGLTDKAIKSAELNGKELDCGRKLKFKNGVARCDGETYEVRNIAFGDLNGDHVNDAAVNIVSRPDGGNGRLGYLAVFVDVGGKPSYAGAALYAKEHLPADVKSIAIEDGKIVLNILGLGESDGFCCPTMKIHEVYQVQDKGLALVPGRK